MTFDYDDLKQATKRETFLKTKTAMKEDMYAAHVEAMRTTVESLDLAVREILSAVAWFSPMDVVMRNESSITGQVGRIVVTGSGNDLRRQRRN